MKNGLERDKPQSPKLLYYQREWKKKKKDPSKENQKDLIRCESEKEWGEEVILGLLANKSWWVRPLTEIKTRSEEPGFGNRRDKARVMR